MGANKRLVFLEKVESDYLRSQIDSGDNTKAKNALQRLCKLYRLGLAVRPELRMGMVHSLIGTCFNEYIDERVRRWVLNALARLGTEGDCLPAVKHVLSNFGNEPQTVASGIAAVFRLCKRQRPEDILRGLSFDPKMITLAALQHVPPHELDLKELPLNIDKASPDLLKLALVVVGLGRSPENLLNPHHSDAEMVRVLGGYDDAVVSQYSVWAITENSNLRVADLGISITDIDDYPPNVRAWVLQLLAMEANDNEPYWEIIEHGMTDRSPETRRGLALGFRDTFVDIFETLILDWLINESDAEVRQHLLEHVIKQSYRSPKYHQFAIEMYDGEAPGSLLRQSMEACAIRTPLYPRFKAIDAGALGDLFGGATYVAEQNINITNLNAGAAAVGSGNATNTGATNIQVLSQQKIEAVHAELAKLEAALHGADLIPAERQRALDLVRDAKDDPTPSKIGRVIEVIGHLGTLAEAGTTLAPYAVALGTILGIG